MQPVISAATLTAGLRATFSDAYKFTVDARLPRLRKVMDLGLPSDKLTELYAYYETAPYPRRWPRGEEIGSKAFKSVQFSVTNYDWARRIPWHENDREDDQTKSLFDQARSLGQHFATLHERIFFQILLSQVDPELLPAIPNAPDGAPLYDTNPRFGISTGNVIAGAGVATPIAVRNNIINAIETFKLMQDTERQPLWDEAMLDSEGYVIIYNVANDLIVREALKASLIAIGANTETSNAAISNIVVEEGYKIDLWPTQRISDDKIHVCAAGSNHKGIFQQERRAMRESFANMDNSDHSRDTKEEYLQYDARYGYGVFLPYQMILIDN